MKLTVKRKTLLFLVLVAAATLSYGYYHQSTHGAAHVSLRDSDRRFPRDYFLGAEFSFFDAGDAVLARGRMDAQFQIVRWQHPAVGDCVKEERAAAVSGEGRQAWRRCFESHSTWFMAWVPQVTHAAIRSKECHYRMIPVQLSRSGDTWHLWWVPHPHIGGKPYTYFNLVLILDKAVCAHQ